jgi:DNA-binding NarL/FixJ family response regulator
MARILFADDSQIMRSTIRSLLIEFNPTWEIYEAQNGKETLEKTSTLNPDVVILDLNFPDMPGSEVARLIRALPNPPRIVICSLGHPAQLALASKEAGADAYITKSSFIEEFEATLSALLGK